MATATTHEETKDAFRRALFGESGIGRRHFDEYWRRLEERSAEPPLLNALEQEPGGTIRSQQFSTQTSRTMTTSQID